MVAAGKLQPPTPGVLGSNEDVRRLVPMGVDETGSQYDAAEG